MSTYSRIIWNSTRNYFSKAEWAAKGGGVRYGLITYYPRHPNHKDPPVQPTKLFMVRRVAPFKGNPYWEKKILEHLGLDGRHNEIAIVKNIPENNARLWKVKHLIKITPIQLPENMPKEVDLDSTYLHENGTFMVTPKVKPDPKRVEATEKYINDRKRLDGETLRKDSRLKWMNPW